MKTVIVGAGLSGLYAAMRLLEQGDEVIVLEGRDRAGGRIKSERSSERGPAYDLGSTWYWPDRQPKLPKLLDEFGIKTFKQWALGATVFEPQVGPAQLMPPQPEEDVPHRIEDGAGTLIDALCARLPEGCIHFRQTVTRIDRRESGVTVRTVRDAFEADRVLVAMPTRVATKILFTPELPDDVLDQMRARPTCLAWHAKFVAVYDRPVWRDRALSGTGISQKGPLMETHDASPNSFGSYALFGFVGVSAAGRKGQEEKVKALAVEQLVRMFGKGAKKPLAVFYKDWAEDRRTAASDDMTAPEGAAVYGPIDVPEAWSGALAFIGAETASENGGHMEGSLEAVDAAIGGGGS